MECSQVDSPVDSLVAATEVAVVAAEATVVEVADLAVLLYV